MVRPKLQSGPLVRTRKMERHYVSHRGVRGDHCDFCHFSLESSQTRREYDHFWLVENIFPYALWDGCRVTEHLLLSPKRHIESLSELTPQESTEYVQIISGMEDEGYAVYARPANSAAKSVPHQHSHFIRIDNKKIKTLYYNYLPHVLWFK